MMKLRKQLITFLMILLVFITFSCDTPAEISIGNIEKPIDIASISKKDHNGLLILDSKISQLFLYNLDEDCYLDFSKELPLNNGIILPKYPYKLVVSDDSKKAIILSSNNTMSIIDLSPFYDMYQINCKQTTLPLIEFSKKMDYLSDDVIIKKSEGFNYEILLVDKKNKIVEFYNYDGDSLTSIYKKTYDSKILYLYSNKNGNYISLENQKNIIKISSDGSEEVIDVTDISVDYKNIDKFIVAENEIYIYSKYENKLFVWNRIENKYSEIPASYNPLDPTSLNPSKSLKLSYNLNSMSLYKQEYNIQNDKLLNESGYLNLNQLLEGNYILLTDVGGYFYFLTIDTSKNLITKYPQNDYSNLEDYKTALDKQFLKLQIPLQSEYKAEILTVIQPKYCTQFNKQEADECFSVVNEEDNTDNRYLLLKDSVKNREYDLDNDYFKFTFEGVLENFISNDGSFTANNKLNSINIDFSKLNIEANNLQLQVISELPKSKLNDSKCEKYKTVTESQSKGETNKKYYRLIPIISIDNHELTLDITNDSNLSYCYDEAIAFQVRVKNLFLISTTSNGVIGTTSYCTNDRASNPLCKDENNPLCPQECKTAPYYENDLFKIKIFSDKGAMNIDSSISFSLGVTSSMSRYRDSIMSPLKSVVFKNKVNKQSKNGLVILDSYQNQVFVIDTNSFEKTLTLIK